MTATAGDGTFVQVVLQKFLDDSKWTEMLGWSGKATLASKVVCYVRGRGWRAFGATIVVRWRI